MATQRNISEAAGGGSGVRAELDLCITVNGSPRRFRQRDLSEEALIAAVVEHLRQELAARRDFRRG